MQWEPHEAGLEEGLQALQEIRQKHLGKKPRASRTTLRWVVWEERRLALEAAEEAARKVQVMEAIRASSLPVEEKWSLYEATLELGSELGLEYLNREREKRGDPHLIFYGAYLAQERKADAAN